MPSYPLSAAALAWAEAILAGPLDEEAIRSRLIAGRGRKAKWIDHVAALVAARHRSRPTAAALARLLAEDRTFARVMEAENGPLLPRKVEPLQMAPAWRDAAAPPLVSDVELAAWLGLSLRQLEALVDDRGLLPKSPDGPWQHYRCMWRAKRMGGWRLIAAPKARLKQCQRKILDEILAAAPVHEAAHGFRRGRSIATYAAPHVGQRVVIRLDLEDFFATVSAARALRVFLAIGYPEPVAWRLTRLCTHAAPSELLDHLPAETPRQTRWRCERLYLQRHLPQGAPTSPALANLCAFGLDRRLSGLAQAAGAAYTRYADDLLFSGGDDLARKARRLTTHAAAVALDEGFQVNFHKLRVMRRGVQQRAAGLVLNERLNVPRRDYDRLKATLHRLSRCDEAPALDDDGCDLRARLTGQVAFVASIHAQRGAKLKALLDQVRWEG